MSLSNTAPAEVSVLPLTFTFRLLPAWIIGSVVSTVTFSSVSSMLNASVSRSLLPFSLASLMCSLQLCSALVTIGPVPSKLPETVTRPFSPHVTGKGLSVPLHERTANGPTPMISGSRTGTSTPRRMMRLMFLLAAAAAVGST